MDTKEKWANEVFASVEGMNRAIPSDKLFSKINAQIPVLAKYKTITLKHLKWAAVAACFIIAINIFAVFKTIQDRKTLPDNNNYQILTDLTIYK